MDTAQHDEFARLYIESQGRVYGFIATILPNRDDAEDVLQRTSMIMWQKWDQFDSTRGSGAFASLDCGFASDSSRAGRCTFTTSCC